MERVDFTQYMANDLLRPYREWLAKRKPDLFFKRFFDILLSIVCMAILVPFYLLAAAAIKLTSPGPVFFLQERVGRGGRPFNIIKFRTMAVDKKEVVRLTVGNDDPRVTKVGGFLRVTHMDEFPQFFNVFKGDMSLIGVRADVPEYCLHFIPEDYATMLLRPGMTSPASIKYRHENELLRASDDPEKKYIEEILPAKMAVNRAYIREYSFWNDVRILGRTFKCVFEKDEALEGVRQAEK
ncbi:MAG: sugar transferase [Clostridia bacterium]|nr:sugar transferase [Clostridia bacterium]